MRRLLTLIVLAQCWAATAFAGVHGGDFNAVVAPTPTVSQVLPIGGGLAGGTLGTITGTNFCTNSCTQNLVTSVKFGSNSATSFSVVSATQINFTTPAGTGTVSVSAANASNSGSLSSAFTYADFQQSFAGCTTSSGVGATPSLDCPPATQKDINNVQLGGTEIRWMSFHIIPNGDPMPGGTGEGGGSQLLCSNALIASWNGSGCVALFAGNGWWSDLDCPSSSIAPQVLALFDPAAAVGAVGGWVQDATLPTPGGTTCNAAAGGNSAFTVTNSIEDLPFKYNTAGSTVNQNVIVGAGSSTALFAARRDDTGAWPTFSTPGTGTLRAIGEHDDTSGGTPQSYLLLGTDSGNITDYTWTSLSTGFVPSGGNAEAWPASAGCSGGIGSPANCTNFASDWAGQTIPAAAYTITTSGSTVTITWQSGATDGALTGKITVSSFSTGGGSGDANGNGTFTVTSNSTTKLTYTAAGSITCGTACTATISSNSSSPLQQSNGCVWSNCGTSKTRIMAQVNCDGSAFATAGGEVYKRVDADTASTWELWAIMPIPDAAQAGTGNGFRALSCIPSSLYTSGSALLATTENTNQGSVWRMDPGTRFAVPIAQGGSGSQCYGGGTYCGLKGIGAAAWHGGGPGDNGEGSGGGEGGGINTGAIVPYPNASSPTIWLFGEGDSRSAGIASDHPSWNGATSGAHSEASSGFFTLTYSGSTPTFTLYPAGYTFASSSLAEQYAAMTPKIQWSATGGTNPGLANNLSPYCTSTSGGGLCSVQDSTRALVVSQFPNDACQYLFYGGFDAAGGGHDMAWIMRAPVSLFANVNAASTGHC